MGVLAAVSVAAVAVVATGLAVAVSRRGGAPTTDRVADEMPVAELETTTVVVSAHEPKHGHETTEIPTLGRRSRDDHEAPFLLDPWMGGLPAVGWAPAPMVDTDDTDDADPLETATRPIHIHRRFRRGAR